jgi:hypothetical protein
LKHPTFNAKHPSSKKAQQMWIFQKDGEQLSLSAFCEVGGAKWGEGRGEVPRSIHLIVV